MKQTDFEKITTTSADENKPYQILFSRKDFRRPINGRALLSVLFGLALLAAVVAVNILIKG